MRYKMTYVFLMLFLFFSIPYLVTAFMGHPGKEQEIEFDTYDSGYKVEIEGGKTIDLESYLWMILPGQISLDDEEEALKAQAVILRTDIIRRMGNGKKIKEENLPYERMSDEKLKEALGSKKYSIKDHARKQAVSETLGEVLIYDGKYIEPFFHGISVGKTMSGKEWFGKEFPYLKAKDSVKDVEAKDYMTVSIISYGKILEKIQSEQDTDMKEADLKSDLSVSKATKSGYVKEVKAGSIKVSGTKWAEWFSLASNNFYLEPYKGKLRMVCLGQGNGLGMSQYGANEMAKEGEDYQKILKYYYSGVKIKKLSE